MYRANLLPGRSLAQLRANTVKELTHHLPLSLDGDWHLAGDHLLDGGIFHGSCRFGSMAGELSDESRHAALTEWDSTLSVDEVREVVRRYFSHCSATMSGEEMPDVCAGRTNWNGTQGDVAIFAGLGWSENHSIRDYAKLLRIGYGGLKHEIAESLSRYPRMSSEYIRRENFLQAAEAVCDAGIALGRRYAELAASSVTIFDDPLQKRRRKYMAEVCRRVPEHGAKTFHEAVQALWFGHIIACAEDGINANSLGRVDQILNPYYQDDLATGRITRDEAKDLLTELAIKLYLDYDVQAITLGGVDTEGHSAINDLSYLMLEATEDFGEIRDLSVRINRDTPESFLRACTRSVLRGGGIPFFLNDECFIPALTERGIALEDARDYAPIGCIELTIPGKANPHAVSGWFNLLGVLELTLFGGTNPETGVQIGPKTGPLSEHADFTSFWEAFRQQTTFFAQNLVYGCRSGEQRQREFGPLPGLSLLTDDCIARGRDLTDGGVKYNFHGIALMGVPNVADAMYAVRRLVFDEKKVTAEALLSALRENFTRHEALRQQLRTLPKYGNNHDEVDAMAKQLASDFIGLMDQWSEPDNRLFVHLFSFYLNINYGVRVGATPDSRKAGEPLAYSLSAHQGRDIEGVTSMLQSLAKMPHRCAAGASAAIIDLHPSIFAGVDAETLFTRILQSSVTLGVGQTQWNVVSAERLERAREDPEHYGNIPVRVAGYSQLFRLINPELQDHIISRHKHVRG